MQFDKPSVRVQFDSDSKAAEAARKVTFNEAAKDGTMIGASHLSFPGLGHIRGEKSGYTFVPVNITR